MFTPKSLSSWHIQWSYHNQLELALVLASRWWNKQRSQNIISKVFGFSSPSSIVPMAWHGNGICDVQTPQSSCHLRWNHSWYVGRLTNQERIWQGIATNQVFNRPTVDVGELSKVPTRSAKVVENTSTGALDTLAAIPANVHSSDESIW